MTKRFVFWVGAVLFFSVSICRGEGKLKKASFIPLWSPQAQFAGYYAAYEKGIYKNHGLDVTIIQGGYRNPPARLLKTGKADFGILWLSAAIRERSGGAPLVNLAQVTQRSALVLVAKKSSGIVTPRDMNGKKISCWKGDLEIQPKAFLKKYNIKATLIPQAYTVNLFLRDGVDVISAMWYNEYHTILNSGINAEELTTFFYDQHGLNFPEDGIYAREDIVSRDPGLCRRFVQASLEGWAYAFAHQDEAVDIILKYMKEAGLPANRIHQKWMLEDMKELMMPGGKQYISGALDKDDYERVASEMLKSGVIKTAPDFASFYKPALPQ